MKRDFIVSGASAGGVEVLSAPVAQFPADYSGAFLHTDQAESFAFILLIFEDKPFAVVFDDQKEKSP